MNILSSDTFLQEMLISSCVQIACTIRKTISYVINIKILETLKPHNFFKTYQKAIKFSTTFLYTETNKYIQKNKGLILPLVPL